MMKIKTPWKRLEKKHFWHAVDAEHNRLISEELKDCREVLDLGCGYGSLTAYLSQAGFQACGVDADPQAIEQSKLLFPALDPECLQVMNADALNFATHQFDGLVLRDTLHHLWEEGDIQTAFAEIERVLKPGGILVIFDPNPNWVVRTCRWLVGHRDAQCTFQQARALLIKRGWIIRKSFFYDFFAMALSVGYVGVELTPHWPFLQHLLLRMNRAGSQLIARAGLGTGSILLWRYVIRAEQPSGGERGIQEQRRKY